MEQKIVLDSNNGNIFASELQRMLNRYGMGLEHLTDRAGIHPEKVRRLIRSLNTSQSLPVLNTQEMKMLRDCLSLDKQDKVRLQAALLTTTIQRTLMTYLPFEHARLTAEALLPTIIQYLDDHQDTKDSDTVRGGDFAASEDTDLDDLLASALDAIDSGAEALQMSYFHPSQRERTKKALQARTSFSTAMELLKQVSIAIQLEASWQYWYKEARQGLLSTNQRLKELGE